MPKYKDTIIKEEHWYILEAVLADKGTPVYHYLYYPNTKYIEYVDDFINTYDKNKHYTLDKPIRKDK
jgi:hypothetical protein